MAQRTWLLAIAAAAVASSLAACGRGADSGATANPNAPGSPGNNERVVSQPAAPDGAPGGPSGIKGSAPHTGSSGGDVPPGLTGSGTAEAGGRTQAPAPGTGLNGGLGMAGTAPAGGGTSAPMGAGPAAAGSPNTTTDSAVGRR